jgi:transposase
MTGESPWVTWRLCPAYLGKEDGAMPTERIPGKPSTRRYSPAEREQAVRLVRQLRKELGTDQGTIARVAKQLGYGVESVRAWVNQADIDGGVKDGTSTEDAQRIKELEQEVRELRRANEILKKASAYFAQAELDRPPR